MAHIDCWLGSFEIFRGSGPVLPGNPINLCFFQEESGPPVSSSGSVHGLHSLPNLKECYVYIGIYWDLSITYRRKWWGHEKKGSG